MYFNINNILGTSFQTFMTSYNLTIWNSYVKNKYTNCEILQRVLQMNMQYISENIWVHITKNIIH